MVSRCALAYVRVYVWCIAHSNAR